MIYDIMILTTGIFIMVVYQLKKCCKLDLGRSFRAAIATWRQGSSVPWSPEAAAGGEISTPRLWLGWEGNELTLAVYFAVYFHARALAQMGMKRN